MPVALLLLFALIALVGAERTPAAWAAPVARQRVVLADPDPELRHAMEQALAPWHLEVVIDGPAPRDAVMAQLRADDDTARFVVWRDGDQLVVYDRELGSIERRDTPAGVLDAPTAAAAALTIKMMMRLPPPPAAEAAPIVAPAPAAAELGPHIRLQAGIATRFPGGDATAFSARFAGGVAIRPWATSGWRFGLAGDGGTTTSVSRAGFKGTWQDWAALGVVSWSYARAAWEIEPHVGLGVRRATLDGSEMSAPRSEAATLATVRGGLGVHRRTQRWTFGAQLAVDTSFSTPTYIKVGTPAEIFQVPALAVALGAVLAVEL